MRGVLMIAVLLRFMDSFMIYTEPFVLTGGGPGNATTFLSQYLTQKAVGQFDLGPAAAFSLIYFLIILLLCFVLYNFMRDVGDRATSGAHDERRTTPSAESAADAPSLPLAAACRVPAVHARADLLDGAHEPARQPGDHERASPGCPRSFSLANYVTIFTDPPGTTATSTRSSTSLLNTVLSVAVALPAAYAFSRYSFIGDKHLFFWLLTNRMTPPAVFLLPVLSALYGDRPHGYAHRGRARAHGVQRAARGVDPRGLHVRRTARDRRDRVHRRLFVPAAFS